jgi:hypothetical protein
MMLLQFVGVDMFVSLIAKALWIVAGSGNKMRSKTRNTTAVPFATLDTY